jgi:hypothetical protein
MVKQNIVFMLKTFKNIFNATELKKNMHIWNEQLAFTKIINSIILCRGNAPQAGPKFVCDVIYV